MSAATDQLIPELTRRVAELAQCVARLTKQAGIDNDSVARLTQSVRIELLTENGFWIARAWELNGAAPPDDGAFCFVVRDPDGNERAVTVEIADSLINGTGFRTRGRILRSSSFWICCAESHLADYIAEHECCPNNRLTVECLDCEEIMLGLRWEISDF